MLDTILSHIDFYEIYLLYLTQLYLYYRKLHQIKKIIMMSKEINKPLFLSRNIFSVIIMENDPDSRIYIYSPRDPSFNNTINSPIEHVDPVDPQELTEFLYNSDAEDFDKQLTHNPSSDDEEGSYLQYGSMETSNRPSHSNNLTHNNTIEVTTDMYIDPETGEDNRCINGVWYNITKEIQQGVRDRQGRRFTNSEMKRINRRVYEDTLVPSKKLNSDSFTNTSAIDINKIAHSSLSMETYRNTNVQRVPSIPVVNNTNYQPNLRVTPKFRNVTMQNTNVQRVPSIPVANNTNNRQYKTQNVNPYTKLPRDILERIITERDIRVSGSFSSKAAQLFELDQIMPDWIESVIESTIDNFHKLVTNKVYIFGILNNVSYCDLPRLSDKDIVNYTRVSILLNTPGHHSENMLNYWIDRLSQEILKIFANKLGISDNVVKFIPINSLKNAIATRDITQADIATADLIAERYNKLKSHKYRQQIIELYGIRNSDDWVRIAHSQPDPMELLIVNLDTYDDIQVIKSLGMAVPPSFADAIKIYIVNNIVAYAKILERGFLDQIPSEVLVFMDRPSLKGYFEKLTDLEIFDTIGVYVPYTNRHELIDNITSCVSTPRFMVPCQRSYERSKNKTTIMMSDITDTSVFMVCYGTALGYYTYELEDLLLSFRRDEETHIMSFKHPENQSLRFSIKDIEGLVELLKCYPPNNEINTLIERIDEVFINERETINHDIIASRELDTFNNSDSILVKDFLRHIFYIGMYMRRWKGPGHPYPLAESDTIDKKIDPNLKVNQELFIGREILDKMSNKARTFCMNLKLCQYSRTGTIDLNGNVFRNEWIGVLEGENCIRMASSRFIGTGLHYLRALYRENISGVDVTAIDRIV